MNILLITDRIRSCGKVMFLQLSVILFTGGGLPQCMLGYHTPTRHPPPEQTPPWRRHPPGAGTPQSRHPQSRHPPQCRDPPAQCMLRDTANKWAVCILLECNLVLLIFLFLVTVCTRCCCIAFRISLTAEKIETRVPMRPPFPE